MQTGLNTLAPGMEAVITQMHLEKAIQQRLQDFGLVPGTKVYCCYRSPGGRVTALEFRGVVLALRTRDLEKIRVRR